VEDFLDVPLLHAPDEAPDVSGSHAGLIDAVGIDDPHFLRAILKDEHRLLLALALLRDDHGLPLGAGMDFVVVVAPRLALERGGRRGLNRSGRRRGSGLNRSGRRDRDGLVGQSSVLLGDLTVLAQVQSSCVSSAGFDVPLDRGDHLLATHVGRGSGLNRRRRGLDGGLRRDGFGRRGLDGGLRRDGFGRRGLDGGLDFDRRFGLHGGDGRGEVGGRREGVGLLRFRVADQVAGATVPAPLNEDHAYDGALQELDGGSEVGGGRGGDDVRHVHVLQIRVCCVRLTRPYHTALRGVTHTQLTPVIRTNYWSELSIQMEA
jgi:hypothetical protein